MAPAPEGNLVTVEPKSQLLTPPKLGFLNVITKKIQNYG